MTSKGVSLADMRSSVPGLPTPKYKVAVAWNPLTNTDVGWLTLEKGVEVRLSVPESGVYCVRWGPGGREAPGCSSEHLCCSQRRSLVPRVFENNRTGHIVSVLRKNV